MTRKFLLLLMLLSSLLFPFKVYADDGLPFNIPKDDDATIKPVSTEGLFGGLETDLGAIFAPMYGWAIVIITIIFITGSFVMLLSVLFKNGQWQKFSQLLMAFSFISILTLRGMPLIILSIKDPSTDIDYLLQGVTHYISAAVIYAAVVGIVLSFLFRFGYKLIKHPEFHRWSRTLRSISILMVVFSFIIPWIFPSI